MNAHEHAYFFATVRWRLATAVSAGRSELRVLQGERVRLAAVAAEREKAAAAKVAAVKMAVEGPQGERAWVQVHTAEALDLALMADKVDRVSVRDVCGESLPIRTG